MKRLSDNISFHKINCSLDWLCAATCAWTVPRDSC